MIRIFISIAMLAVSEPVLAADLAQHLCGWVENPTPAN